MFKADFIFLAHERDQQQLLKVLMSDMRIVNTLIFAYALLEYEEVYSKYILISAENPSKANAMVEQHMLIVFNMLFSLMDRLGLNRFLNLGKRAKIEIGSLMMRAFTDHYQKYRSNVLENLKKYVKKWG